MRAVIVAVVLLLFAVPATVYVATKKVPHTAIRVLLNEPVKGDAKHKSRFFSTLSALVGDETRTRFQLMGDGHAVEVKDQVVVVLQGGDGARTSYHYLLLFNRDARLLDEMACVVRHFVREPEFEVVVGVPTCVTEVDGATISIRLASQKGDKVVWTRRLWIEHGANRRSLSWDSREHQPTQRVLLRAEVQNGQFNDVCPDMVR